MYARSINSNSSPHLLAKIIDKCGNAIWSGGYDDNGKLTHSEGAKGGSGSNFFYKRGFGFPWAYINDWLRVKNAVPLPRTIESLGCGVCGS